MFTIRYSRSHLAPFLCVCFICVCVYHHPRLADLVITHISSLTTVLHSQGLNRCSGMVTFMYPPASELIRLADLAIAQPLLDSSSLPPATASNSSIFLHTQPAAVVFLNGSLYYLPHVRRAIRLVDSAIAAQPLSHLSHIL